MMVLRLRNSTTRMASPMAASAAATVRMKNTNTWPARSCRKCEKAMKLAEQSEDPNCKLWLGTLYNNRGWGLFYLGRYEDAMALHQKCRDWHEARDNVEPALISKWAVAKCLRKLERYDEALAMQQEVLAEREKRELATGFAHEEVAENLQLKELTWIDDDEPGRSARLRKLAGAD